MTAKKKQIQDKTDVHQKRIYMWRQLKDTGSNIWGNCILRISAEERRAKEELKISTSAK